MPWGHRSIALAIYNYLKSQEKECHWKVDYAQVRANTGIGGDIYNWVYRYFPAANLLMHKVSFNKTIIKMAEDLPMINLPALRRTVEKLKPDVIISTYFIHSHSLVLWRKKEGKQFKLWNVVADPWTINGVSLIPEADKNLFYDEVVEKIAAKEKIPKEKLLKTGWWTRPEMYQHYGQKEMRKKLGLVGDYPVIFVGGGSLGTGALTKILPVLPFIKREVGIIFNCGTDKMTYKLVEYYRKLLSGLLGQKELVHIKNFGWIERINEPVAAADIVFGKAGPNFLFDTVAMGKPFVAISHINGQEDGNIDLIRKKKLGWVKEDPVELNRFLFDYLKNPTGYNKKFEKTIAEEAKRNQKSFEIIKNTLSSEELQ